MKRQTRRFATSSVLSISLAFAFTGGFSEASPAHHPHATKCAPSKPSTCTVPELAKRLKFRIGTTVSNARLSQSSYPDVLSKSFNTLTPDNNLKWYSVEPTKGNWQFAAAEAELAFANAHQMEFWGHNLIYNQDPNTPAWVTSLSDPVQLRAAVKTWIQTVVGHFRGRVHRWVVVNEPLATTSVGPQDSVFERKLGPNWIDWCFKIAHEADPKAELWLNEYGTDWVTGKAAVLQTLVKGMKARHVPIYGVGLEMHRPAYPGPDVTSTVAQIQAFSKMGLKTAFTEVDVPIQPGNDGALNLQAEAYGRIMTACLTAPNCKEVTTWGLDDAHTWLDHQWWTSAPSRPLLFDGNLAPKSSYEMVRSCLARAVMKSSHLKGTLPPCTGWKN